VAGTGGARCSALRRLETPEGEHWHYRYDVFGRRIAKFCSNPGEATRRRHGIRETYLWMADRLIESRRFGPDCDLLDTTLWHYRAERFDPLAREVLGADDSRCYPIASDPNGTPHTLYNSQGQIVWQAGHTLWGSPRERDYGSELQPTRYPETVPDCPLRFPGQWADPESGLHYNLHRYYDPHSGQYLSPDPIGLAGGLRTYAYVHDPLQWVDPWGLQECGNVANSGSAEIGSKLEYFLGRATGSQHNIDRSQGMLRQLESIGLPDTPATREYLSQHLSETYSNAGSVLRTQENGRVVRESLLMGPQGGVKFETIWDGNRLITGEMFGPTGRFYHGPRPGTQ